LGKILQKFPENSLKYPQDFRPQGVGLATVKKGVTVSTRMKDKDGAPLYIFTSKEPVFAEGTLVNSTIYLYASVSAGVCTSDTLVARVNVSDATDRSKYQFWTGSDWSSSLAAGIHSVQRTLH
jgi:hypothetical protein